MGIKHEIAALQSTRSYEKRRYKNPNAYWMIMPSYLIYFIFVFIPMAITIYFSFTNYDLYKTRDFIGLNNYIKMLSDPIFKTSVYNTGTYALFTIIPPIAIGLIVAVVLNSKIFGQSLARIAFYIPHITSMVSVSMIWLWIYDPSLGILNQIMKAIGLPARRWLFDTNLAMGSIVVMSIWKVMGYNMIIYLAGLQNIPQHLYEAATVDGASSIRQFFSITIPMLRPTTFFLFVMSCINAFNVFDQVNVMTQGGPVNSTTTIVHQIYQRAFTNFEMGYASAMAVFLLLITIILTMFNFKYGNQGADIGLD